MLKQFIQWLARMVNGPVRSPDDRMDQIIKRLQDADDRMDPAIW